MQAIYEKKYVSICVQLQRQMSFEQFNQSITDFLLDKQEEDRNMELEVQNALKRINNDVFKFQNETIILISDSNNQSQKLTEFLNDLLQLNDYLCEINYYKYWCWIQYFYNECISKTLILLDTKISFEEDCVLLYLAYVTMLHQIEISNPKQTLTQMESDSNFIQIPFDRKKALEILDLSGQTQ